MRKHKHPEHVNNERWLVSYADFITLLFAFFVVMFSVSQVDSNKAGKFSESFQAAVGLQPSPFGAGVMPAPGDRMQAYGDQSQNSGADEKLPKELEGLKTALGERALKGEDLAGLKVLRRRNELVLRLSEGVVFGSGDDKLKDQANKVLLAIAEEVKTRGVNLRVEGHTDNVPIRSARYPSNWELSTARATAVINMLAAQANLPPGRLAAAGYGEFHPVASNETEEGRQQNRRVDLVVSTRDPESEEVPLALTADKPKPAAPHAAQAPGAPSLLPREATEAAAPADSGQGIIRQAPF